MSTDRYKTHLVRANAVDGGGPDALQACLDRIPMDRRVHSILSWAHGNGYTNTWIVVTEPLPR